MPGGNGTGPRGRDNVRGMGQGKGRGKEAGGNCVCPSCGVRADHQLRSPCYEQKCPKCGKAMTRE